MKTILITGAGVGLGRALARRFAREGEQVILLGRTFAKVQEVRAGTVSVNGGLSIAPDIPFGGYKKSGIGREWGIEGINEFLEVKLIGIGVAA